MSLARKKIFIDGDIWIDHEIYSGLPYALPTHSVTSITGAKLLYDLIECIRKNSLSDSNPADYHVENRSDYDKKFLADMSRYAHRYTLWKPYPVQDTTKTIVWRIAEQLGAENNSHARSRESVRQSRQSSPWMVVINDDALNFRFRIDQRLVRLLRKGGGKHLEWILVKTTYPPGQGDLWRLLTTQACNKLIVIISAEDLRRCDVRISCGSSWEKTVEDVIRELKSNESIRELLKCKHLIVTLGMEGALLVTIRDRQALHYTLVFDPAHMENSRTADVSGRMPNALSCLVVSIAHKLAQSGSDGLPVGIQLGLTAMTALHIAGHGQVGEGIPGFPLAAVSEAIQGRKAFRFTSIEVDKNRLESHWTILSQVDGVRSVTSPKPLFGIARRVALLGPVAFMDIPHAQYGKLVTIDRDEIETLHNLCKSIRDYAVKSNQPRPLSLAVFGPPGAGKSFGIKEIAKVVLGDRASFLEFNLSQFTVPTDLIGAFHQVRDKILHGTLPIVFWDEFDSREYFWLQYLLSPMQDGTFQEGQLTHPIGRCIFVFAGATSYDMEHFGPRQDDVPACRSFSLMKGPDFISRLHGYLNVLGPNRRQIFDVEKNAWVDDPKDICFPIRRALLLRSILGLTNSSVVLDIDHGLLSAVLEVSRYYYGARSMEGILVNLKRSDGKELRRSNLPPDEVLAASVDVSEFTNLCSRDVPFKASADTLAPAIHEVWLRLAKKNGWKVQYNMPFDKLPNDIKEDNRAAAIRIPHILAMVGLYIIPRDSHKMNEVEIGRILEHHIEFLAEAEHKGWMDHKLQNGWMYGEKRKDKLKIHHALVEYKHLAESDKEKDRNSVRHYPAMVELAGYKIVTDISHGE